ncbi:MAG: hypothetical protein WD423_00660 [Rhodothermales bacterium]
MPTDPHMPTDPNDHLETGRRILQRMAASPCEFVEVAFEAEKHAVEASGAERSELRAAVQTIDNADGWTDRQRDAFVSYVQYLDEHMS